MGEEGMSGVLASANAYRIKASHRRRRTVASGRRRQRYYDPTIGRFLSTDPVAADANTGSLFNRYWYASNNPYRFTDPDGRCDNSPSSFCNFVKGIVLAVHDTIAPIANAIADPDGTKIDGSYDRFGPGSNPMTQGGYKFGGALITAEAIKAPSTVAGAVVDAKAPVALTEAQTKNLARFNSKLPAANTGTTVERTGKGVTFTSEVPGKVPGSQATYQKTVNSAGQTTGYTKTTTAPSGQVIHVKDKFPDKPQN
ncbi:RHS repeat-associated core domain-containing protein [Solilutibacter silvestris]|uniref:RHS repeat-associated core domain-containing protein n=1 Tax=Solilutibacter silvestris TaxID=1645665 RepID=UPI001F0CB3AA|nr:RHS repeat-associated core domain-containing protein [Lysobacter silvestris]